MFCEYCGKPVEEDSAFCAHCGKGIAREEPVTTPQTAAPKKSGAKIFVIIFLLAVVSGGGFFYWQTLNSDGLTGRTISIYDIVGAKATMTKADDREYAAQKGIRLGADYSVSSGEVTYVYLDLDDKSLAKMDEISKVNVAQISENKLRLDLESGAILINERNKGRGELEIRAGAAVLGIRGTFITANYSGANVDVYIVDGAVEVTAASGEVTYAGARKRVAISNDVVTVDDLRWSRIDDFTRECILEYRDDLSDVLSEDDFNAIIGNNADYVAGNIIEFGGYDWRVLETTDSKALIISENILELKVYNGIYQDVTWESCDLRQYLNGDFYNGFTTAERARIIESRNTNADNPWYGTSGGRDTVDKVFLLSLDELVRYFGDSGELGNGARRGGANGGEYFFSDQYDSARIATAQGVTYSWWWLRSPGLTSRYAAHVDHEGVVHVDGLDVYYALGGVRPAMWLNM